MYEFDFNKMIQWLLPSVIRKDAHVLWLNALLAGLKTIHGKFVFYANSAKKHANTTGQKRIMEFYIRKSIAPCNIKDSDSEEPIFIFLESENNPVYLPTFLTGSSVDFIVEVPISSASQDAELRLFLDTYKLPTKRYEIIYI